MDKRIRISVCIYGVVRLVFSFFFSIRLNSSLFDFWLYYLIVVLMVRTTSDRERREDLIKDSVLRQPYNDGPAAARYLYVSHIFSFFSLGGYDPRGIRQYRVFSRFLYIFFFYLRLNHNGRIKKRNTERKTCLLSIKSSSSVLSKSNLSINHRVVY